MASISMCSNKSCALRERCYRYRAVPDRYDQAYGDFFPDHDGVCTDFWDAREYVQKNLVSMEQLEGKWWREILDSL